MNAPLTIIFVIGMYLSAKGFYEKKKHFFWIGLIMQTVSFGIHIEQYL